LDVEAPIVPVAADVPDSRRLQHLNAEVSGPLQ
jgi:hypothetical protein